MKHCLIIHKYPATEHVHIFRIIDFYEVIPILHNLRYSVHDRNKIEALLN